MDLGPHVSDRTTPTVTTEDSIPRINTDSFRSSWSLMRRKEENALQVGARQPHEHTTIQNSRSRDADSNVALVGSVPL
jgi:hypothetical protein